MWEDQAAVFKVWDLGDSLEPLEKMQAEIDTYHKLSLLQASLLYVQAQIIATWFACCRACSPRFCSETLFMHQ